MPFGIIEYSSPLCVIKMPDICQLNCKYCFREYNKQPELLSYTGQDVANLLKHYSEIAVMSFLGGEPLLFETEIKNIIESTKHQIKKYIITTNGLNITEENVKYYIQNHVQINFSLDGEKKYNDINRGKGVHDRVLKSIEILRKEAPSEYFWTISSTFTKNTIHTLFDTYLYIRTITPKGWAINLDKYCNWTKDDLKTIALQLKLIKEHYDTHPKTIKWFLNRINEKNIIYNHSDHLIIHQNGDILQGFPFSKEIIFSPNLQNIKLGNLHDLQTLKPLEKIQYNNLRPCNSNYCKNCKLGEYEFYSPIGASHAELLCTIYKTLLNFDKEE